VLFFAAILRVDDQGLRMGAERVKACGSLELLK
jgi:hypothetical protein